MSFASERATLETRFFTEWGSTSPVAWENVDFTPVPGTAFVDFKLVSGDGDFVGFGSKILTRRIGMIVVNIYTPINGGTNAGRVLADSVAAIFRNFRGGGWQGDNTTCRAASIASLGQIEQWYRHVVTIPYYTDEAY